jgi:hypothetical protein
MAKPRRKFFIEINGVKYRILQFYRSNFQGMSACHRYTRLHPGSKYTSWRRWYIVIEVSPPIEPLEEESESA